MASSRAYLDYVLEQLAELPYISFRPMMGEFILYCDGRIFGGIYDDRLLVKAIDEAVAYMPTARREIPYPGGKPMLLVEDVDDRAFLVGLVDTMFPALPLPKEKAEK